MKETLRRRKPHLSLPKSAARLSWATLSYIFVARVCSAARLSDTFVHLRRPRVQHGTLERHFRTFSSPEGAARHAWATPPRVSAARRYWAKDVRLNLTKKEEVSQKTRETSVGCPKPGSNRHVFKGHWILSPRRLPIPPFGHIHVDFPLDGNFALPLQRIAKLLNFLRYSKTFNKKLMRKTRLFHLRFRCQLENVVIL